MDLTHNVIINAPLEYKNTGSVNIKGLEISHFVEGNGTCSCCNTL